MKRKYIKYKRPIGKCGINLKDSKSMEPKECGEIAFGKILAIPICDNHWDNAIARVWA